MEILNEAYFEKSENLLEIEKILERNTKHVKGLSKEKKYKPTINHPMLASNKKDLQKIEKLLAENFNFEEVIITIDPSPVLNAFTIPVNTNLFNIWENDSLKVIKGKDGYRYKSPKMKFCVINISSSLLDKLTAKETLAIFLHEIGHNFYKQGIIASSLSILFTFHNMIFKSLFYGINKIHNKFLDSETYTTFTKLLHIFSPVAEFVNREVSTITNIQILSKILSNLNNPNVLNFFKINYLRQALGLVANEGFANEEFADNFASTHGYGTDLSSALLTIEKITGSNPKLTLTLNSDKFVVKSLLLVNDSMSLFFTPLDEHPSILNRIKSQLDFIDDEIEKTKDPRVKKLLIKERRNIEKIYLEMKKIQDELHILNLTHLDILKKYASLHGSSIKEIEKDSGAIKAIKFVKDLF